MSRVTQRSSEEIKTNSRTMPANSARVAGTMEVEKNAAKIIKTQPKATMHQRDAGYKNARRHKGETPKLSAIEGVRCDRRFYG